MRRTLAIVLAAGLLLLGGCARARAHHPAPPAAPPAVATTAAPGSADADVDTMLDQVGQQLSNEAQPAEDED